MFITHAYNADGDRDIEQHATLGAAVAVADDCLEDHVYINVFNVEGALITTLFSDD